MAQSPVRTAVHTGMGGKLITAGTPFDCCRAVNCGVAGSATVTWADDSVTTRYFTLGDNACQIKLVAAGGVADILVAVY